MKKKLLFIICLFLLTGCDVTYNLTIDDKTTEETKIIESYDNISDKDEIIFDYYSEKVIPLLRTDPFDSEGNEKYKNVSYYDVKKMDSDANIGLNITGKFTDDYTDSNIIWYGADITKNTYQNGFELIGNNFKVFDQYSNLNQITINIKSKYLVNENNADSVKNNTYTWIINRNNYKNKTVKISFRTKIIKDDSITKFAIVLTIIVAIGATAYLIIRRISKKNNSL